jgi:hypothetical protein
VLMGCEAHAFCIPFLLVLGFGIIILGYRALLCDPTSIMGLFTCRNEVLKVPSVPDNTKSRILVWTRGIGDKFCILAWPHSRRIES